MILPTIHLNGTGAEDLLTGYRAAMESVGDALDVMMKARPNARDYYVQSDGAFRQATQEQTAREQKLQSVYDELLALAQHCNDAMCEREARRAERGVS